MEWGSNDSCKHLDRERVKSRYASCGTNAELPVPTLPLDLQYSDSAATEHCAELWLLLRTLAWHAHRFIWCSNALQEICCQCLARAMQMKQTSDGLRTHLHDQCFSIGGWREHC